MKLHLTQQEIQKPNVKDFDLQPYGYIHALQIYVEFLESKIYTKENKTEENIYLNRLREQYKQSKSNTIKDERINQKTKRTGAF